MTEDSSLRQPTDVPGVATAEGGLVLLDGPDGVAITLTPAAAEGTGQSLLAAARDALKQVETPSNRG